MNKIYYLFTIMIIIIFLSLFKLNYISVKTEHFFILTKSNELVIERNAGFGSIINQIIENLIKTEKGELSQFTIYWNHPIYSNDPNQNLWTTHFRQPFDSYDKNIKIDKKQLETANIVPRSKGMLLPPQNPTAVGKIINKYIKFKPHIHQKVNRFLNSIANGDKYKIGLHIRGSGRLDGGVKNMKNNYKLLNGVPIYDYEKQLQLIMSNNCNNVIVIFTDSNKIIEYFKNKYKNIYAYDSDRSDDFKGEIHIRNNDNDKKNKILEDIVVEVMLMSKMNYLIHGNSNITNFVQCLNSNLDHYDIYTNQYM